MANNRESWRLGAYIPVFILLLLSTFQTSKSANNDFLLDGGRVSPSSVSESTLRHIMQLVSLGTGLRVPPPLSLRYREKALKRARLTSPSNRHPEFVIGSEFLGKRSSKDDEKRMGSEFLGKRMGSEFLGKRMGSEFLGKRMGSEFLGKRMGSEFLGKRMGSEFLGKRMGSEFLGKRMGSEFLGKRMGSEFLGKRIGSEFLGKRYDGSDDDNSEFSSEKRMGSEFLGKRDDVLQTEEDTSSKESTDSLIPQSIVYLENKRMGSEFLGRKRRETKTSDMQISGA